MHGLEQAAVVVEREDLRPISDFMGVDDLLVGLEGGNQHPIDRQRDQKKIK